MKQTINHASANKSVRSILCSRDQDIIDPAIGQCDCEYLFV